VDFDTLYRAEGPLLMRFLRAQGAEEQEAWDAVQAAFECLLRAKYPIQRPRFWLRTVALREYRHTCPRVPTRRRKMIETPTGPQELPEPAPSESAAEAVERAEEFERLMELLRDLPTKQRQVMACQLDGLSHEETAELLNMQVAAVRKNYSRARKALSRQLSMSRGGA
jgi:RNA polymerase sigma factor (sigma-70 family)